jgi:hypothetical protein
MHQKKLLILYLFFQFFSAYGWSLFHSYINPKFSRYCCKLKYIEKKMFREKYILGRKLINLQDMLSSLQMIAKDKKTRTTRD